MMKSIFIMLLLMVNLPVLFAQNNAIFSGGNNDGFNRTTFSQAGNNVFTGGNGDGWNYAAFQQPAVNIFTGGNADGWSKASYLQTIVNIFIGGNGDGWGSTTFLQLGNAIFNGGNGDGWSKNSYLQAGNDIFTGGIGDGWSSTYRPMGTIPVSLLYFDARKKGITAELNWRTSQEINTAYFDVERSSDAMNFSYMGSLNASGNSSTSQTYYFTDNHPEKGLNYYRLKQVDNNGHFVYTPSRVVRFDDMIAGFVKYYPNPTSGVLNIELFGDMIKEAKLVNISNESGIVLNQFRLESNASPLLQVDLGKYPKGIYFIQVKTQTVNSTQRIVLQ